MPFPGDTAVLVSDGAGSGASWLRAQLVWLTRTTRPKKLAIAAGPRGEGKAAGHARRRNR